MGVYERYLQKIGKPPLRLWGPESKYGKMLKGSTYQVWPDASQDRFCTPIAKFKPTPDRLALDVSCGIVKTAGKRHLEGAMMEQVDENARFVIGLKNRVTRIWLGRMGQYHGNGSVSLIDAASIPAHMVSAIADYRRRLEEKETRLTNLPLDFIDRYTAFTKEDWNSQVFQHPERHREFEKLIFDALRIESIKVHLLHLPVEYGEDSIAHGFDAPEFALSLTKQRHTVSAVAGFLRVIRSSEELFLYLDTHSGQVNIWDIPGDPGLIMLGKEALIRVSPA